LHQSTISLSIYLGNNAEQATVIKVKLARIIDHVVAQAMLLRPLCLRWWSLCEFIWL